MEGIFLKNGMDNGSTRREWNGPEWNGMEWNDWTQRWKKCSDSRSKIVFITVFYHLCARGRRISSISRYSWLICTILRYCAISRHLRVWWNSPVSRNGSSRLGVFPSPRARCPAVKPLSLKHINYSLTGCYPVCSIWRYADALICTASRSAGLQLTGSDDPEW